MYRRSKDARLLTGGLIGALPVTTPGDEYWNDVTLLLDGSSTTDASTGQNTVTLEGNAAANNTAVSDPFGGTEGSFIFDGSGDAIKSTDGTLIDVGNSQGWTVEMWVRPDTLAPSAQMLAEVGAGTGGWVSGGNSLQFYLTPTNITLQTWDGATAQATSSGAHGMSVNNWYHVAAVYDGSNIRVFVDGDQKASTAATTYENSSATTYFGLLRHSNLFPFDGRMHGVRVTKGVARYTAAFTPPTASFPANAPVVGRRGVGTYDTGDEHWDDVSLLVRGDTLTDLSANGHTITNSGVTAGDTTYTKHSASGSMSFDGSSDFISIPDSDLFDFGSGDFTIELWAYHIGSFDPYTAVFGNRADGNHYGPFGMTSGGGANVPNQMRFFAADSTGSTNSVMLIDPDAFPLNQWVHIAVTREGTTFTLWINGQSKATGTGSWSVYNASEPLYIGKDVTPAGVNMWNGNIEDFRITKGVARYTANFTPPTKSLPTVLAGTPEATATLRTRGLIGAAPAVGGGMLTLYDRYIDALG